MTSEALAQAAETIGVWRHRTNLDRPTLSVELKSRLSSKPAYNIAGIRGQPRVCSTRETPESLPRRTDTQGDDPARTGRLCPADVAALDPDERVRDRLATETHRDPQPGAQPNLEPRGANGDRAARRVRDNVETAAGEGRDE